MSGGFTIDPDHVAKSGGTLERFGAQLDTGGGKLEQAGQRMAQHAGQDKSGVGAVLVKAFGRGTQIAGDVIKEGGRVIKKAGQHLKETGRSHREHDQRSRERFDRIHRGEEGQSRHRSVRGGARRTDDRTSPRSHVDGHEREHSVPPDRMSTSDDPVNLVTG